MSPEVLQSEPYGSIIIEKLENDIDIVHIEHKFANASISLYGGHVLSWCPAGHKEVLWLSKCAEFGDGKAIRGGIPLCWPWFGPNIDAVGQNGGNHGFARNNKWKMTKFQIQPEYVEVELVLSGENKHAMWPNKFELKQILQFGQSFEQKLLMTNLSRQPVHYSCALHSYFSVSHPENSQITELNGELFDDKHRQLQQQRDNLTDCVGPIDRIYYTANPQEVVDTGWRRKIQVSSSCEQWVLWNPGKEIAAGMSDIHSGGENEFVCLEAANTQWGDIAAGGVVQVSQCIKVLKY